MRAVRRTNRNAVASQLRALQIGAYNTGPAEVPISRRGHYNTAPFSAGNFQWL
jgi:hypothetical protein